VTVCVRLTSSEVEKLRYCSRTSKRGTLNLSEEVRRLILVEFARRTTGSSVVPSSGYSSDFRIGRPPGPATCRDQALSDDAMIFSVQRFLEDYFERRGLADVDQYAIRISNTFTSRGPLVTLENLSRDLGKMRTVFYRRNGQITRRDFEAQLAKTLCKQFKKTDRPRRRKL